MASRGSRQLMYAAASWWSTGFPARSTRRPRSRLSFFKSPLGNCGRLSSSEVASSTHSLERRRSKSCARIGTAVSTGKAGATPTARCPELKYSRLTWVAVAPGMRRGISTKDCCSTVATSTCAAAGVHLVPPSPNKMPLRWWEWTTGRPCNCEDTSGTCTRVSRRSELSNTSAVNCTSVTRSRRGAMSPGGQRPRQQEMVSSICVSWRMSSAGRCKARFPSQMCRNTLRTRLTRLAVLS
mmetsp:Transcript_72505/g.160341  ORF Transcript_72505/g.160341 Transcript_72505/m.160341 type:complete len:239 (+) Transcript_72505:1397-2113(+)